MEINTNFEEIINSSANTNFQILAENNKEAIEKILKFFTSDESLLTVTGFLGTGKTEIIQNITQKSAEDCILLWSNCYESTNLDDLFLNFFEKFKHLASNGSVNIPQTKFENFNQRINACFSAITKKIIVVINSYQALMAENVKPINDFINYLAKFQNIKIIIISRNFNQADIDENIKSDKVVLKALDENLFQKLLLNSGIKIYGPIADELYKLTKGYYLYTILAIKVMIANNYNAIDFIRKYSNSFMSLKEFLFQETFKIVNNVNPHLIRFLTVIRYPVNIKLLSGLQLYDKEFLETLSDNLIIETNDGNIYLKDYYKDMSGAEIPQNILAKIHKSCISLYELQLPRKPDNRDLLISRKTLRQEIEYHKIFVPKKYELGTHSIEIYNSQPVIVKSQTQNINNETKQLQNDEIKEPKELKDILFVFKDEEEKTLLTGIAQSINEFMENAKKQDIEENNMPDEKLIEIMNDAEDKFDYKKVISLGKKILIRQNINPDIKLYTAEKTAICYEKLSDIYNSIKYWEMVKNLLNSSGSTYKILECDFNIARLNYKIFKRDYAKEILLSLNKVQNSEIKIKSELLLFDIYLDEGNEEKAFECCKEALSLLDKKPNKPLTCEILFKCGVILDIRKNYTKAIDAYERSLKVSSDYDINKYLIQTYNNLANLYDTVENPEKALFYMKEALKIAQSKNLTEEIFNASLKIAEITAQNSEKDADKLYKETISYAAQLNDSYANITALLSYGDFHLQYHKNLSALENYLDAYKIGKENFYNEIKTLLNERLTSIKSVLNSDVYYAKLIEYKYEE